MTHLIVDTSSDLCLIALAKGHQILSQEIIPHANLLSKILLPAIQSLLQKHSLAPSDLSSIAVGIGPGSYTGTRLGVAVGKSLAFGLQIPLKAFNSLLCFIPPKDGNFVHIMPARSGAFFLLTGKLVNTTLYQEAAGLIPAEELLARAEHADFVICLSPENLPELWKQKPLFRPIPNLDALCTYLSTLEPTPTEEVELLYLHIPG